MVEFGRKEPNSYISLDYQAGISELKVQLDNERKKQNNARERGRIRYINDEFDALQKLLKPWLNGFAPKVRRVLFLHVSQKFSFG